MFGTNLGEAFNVNDVPAPEYGDTPDGKYLVAVTDSQLKPERNNENNIRASLQLTIQDGQYSGRIVFANPCWINVREDLQLYGRQELSSIIKAAGLEGISDLSELNDKLFYVTLKTKPDKNGEPRQRNTYQRMTNVQAPPIVPAQKPSAFKPQPGRTTAWPPQTVAARPSAPHPQQTIQRPAPRTGPAEDLPF